MLRVRDRRQGRKVTGEGQETWVLVEHRCVPGAGPGIYTVTPDNCPAWWGYCPDFIDEEMGSQTPGDSPVSVAVAAALAGSSPPL